MNLEEVKEKTIPILKQNGVKRAGVFGSVARGEAGPDSDVDMLVEIPPKFGLFNFVGLKHELEDVLGRKVDLVEYGAVKPLLVKYVMQDHTPIL